MNTVLIVFTFSLSACCRFI